MENQNLNLMTSFIESKTPGGVPLEVHLNDHLASNTNFHNFDFRFYFVHFIYGMISVIPETQLKEKYEIGQVFWSWIPNNEHEEGAKLNHRISETFKIAITAKKDGRRKLYVKNFFIGEDASEVMKYAPRGLTPKEYEEIMDKVDESEEMMLESTEGIDRHGNKYFDESLDEYLISKVPMFKTETENSKANNPMQIFVQKVKSSVDTLSKWQPAFPDEYFSTFTDIGSESRLFYETPDGEGVEGLDQIIKEISKTKGNEEGEKFTQDVELYFDLTKQLVRPLFEFHEQRSSAAECGFQHGTLLATQSMHLLDPTIYQRMEHVKNEESFFMSLERKFTSLESKITDQPITISFTDKLEGASRFAYLVARKNTISDISAHISSFESYGIPHMMVNSATLDKPMDFISELEEFDVTDYQTFLYPYLELQLNRVRPIDAVYDVSDDSYLSRYLLGMVVSSTHDTKKNLFLSKDNFGNIKSIIVIPELSSGTPVLINIVESTHSDLISDLQIPSSMKLNDMNKKPFLVVNIIEHYRHTLDDFRLPGSTKDFIQRSINIKVVDFAKLQKVHGLNLEPIPQLGVIESLAKSRNMEQMRTTLSKVFNQYSEFIDTKRTYEAFLSGMFHTVPRINGGLQIRRFYSDKMFTAVLGRSHPDAPSGSGATPEERTTFNFALITDNEQDTTEFVKYGSKLFKEQLSIVEKARLRVVNVACKFSNQIKGDNEIYIDDTVATMDELMEKSVCGSRRKRAALGICDKSKNVEEKELENLNGNLPVLKGRMKYLSKVGKISQGIMTGLILRDILSDIYKGDFKALAKDGIFLAASVSSFRLAAAATKLGSWLTKTGRVGLGKFVTRSAPVLKTASSAFVAYDLYDNVHNLLNGDTRTSVKVNIGADSLVLGVTLTETTLEVLELAEVIEGVSEVFGPIGEALGALALVGANIYQAVEEVAMMDDEIHLTGWEKFKEGWRAFLHIGHEEYIDVLLNQKRANEQLLQNVTSLLKSNPQISRYVVNSACPIQNKKTVCDHSNIDLATKFTIQTSRVEPTSINNNNMFMFCRMSNSPLPPFYHSHPSSTGSNTVNSYFCSNAFGIENRLATQKKVTFFNLNSQPCTVVAGNETSNVFRWSSGYKLLYGSSSTDDTFVLTGDNTEGELHGLGGQNTFDFSSIPIIKDRYMTLNHAIFSGGKTRLQITGVHNIIGRKGGPDHVRSKCHYQQINLNGGQDMRHVDHVRVPRDDKCENNLKIIMHSFTDIVNYATLGNFSYISSGNVSGGIDVSLRSAQHVSHMFVLKEKLLDLKNIIVSRTHPTIIYMLTLVMQNDAKINIKVKFSLKSLKIVFWDQAQMTYHNGHLLVTLHTDKSINWVIKTYEELIERSKLTLIAYSTLDQQSITINHGLISFNGQQPFPFRVLHNNPVQPTHILCGYGVNAIVFKSATTKPASFDQMSFPEVTVDFSPLANSSSIKTILDFSPLAEQVKEIYRFHELEIEARVDPRKNDLYLRVAAASQHSFEILGSVIVRQAFKPQIRPNIRIVAYSEFGLDTYILQEDMPAVKLIPIVLHFSESENIIPITDNMVERNQQIKIGRSLFNYDLVNLANTSLMITNLAHVAYTPMSNSSTVTVTIENFYAISKMRTLRLTFDDLEIDLAQLINEHRDKKAIPYDVFVDQMTRINDYLSYRRFDLKSDSFSGDYRDEIHSVHNCTRRVTLRPPKKTKTKIEKISSRTV